MGHEFQKEHRMRTGKDFLRMRSGSETNRVGPLLVLRKLNEFGVARLGLSIRTNRGSVVRNRAKRTLREMFRQERESLGSFDYQVIWTLDPVGDPADFPKSVPSLWTGPFREARERKPRAKRG
jgi:ribonuclease P protein component